MSDFETILVDQNGGVLTITLNRPDKYNALTAVLAKELIATYKKAGRDASVRAILLTGAGKGFCAGQDLGEVSERGLDFTLRGHLNETYNPMAAAMRKLEKPILVAVNGACAGAGFGLALAGDLRFASDRAKFLTAFIGIGLAPDTGVSYWLPRLIGQARAAEMLFTNEAVSAEKAAQIGLINKVIPHDSLLQEATAYAHKLAAMPTKGIGLSKRALNKSLCVNFEDHINYEGYLQDIAAKTDDYKEGVAAFKEKRKPNFTGS